MVIHQDREKVISALAGYLRGEVDNFALDDALMDYRGKDRTIRRIAIAIWSSYGDIKRHNVSLTRKGWQLYRRCIVFLLTDLELPDSRDAASVDHRVWPFQNRSEILKLRPSLSALNLPRFDPSIHCQPIRTPQANAAGWIFIAMIAAIVIFKFLWRMF